MQYERARMALQEGQMLGPYQIIGQLGQGGMATVYKAHHARLDRFVAIKIMHPGFKEDDGFLARFEREAQIVAKLEHSHIVPVYDYSEQDGQPYLVMKYVEGRTLKRILSGGPISLEQIVHIMTPVADALTYAHQHGVLHRDIKPSNIVIDKEGTPFLTDFGLARIAQAGASTLSQDMILGTPQYISPEQASGQRELDPRTDVYSLGVILYEMVVGRVPFNADTPYAIVHDHIYSELPHPRDINPEIPEAVEAVLMKALAKRPADRYESAVEMMQAFNAALDQSGLRELDPQRNRIAEQSFARRAGSFEDDLPTAPPIPAAIRPAPPGTPGNRGRGRGRRGPSEFEFDMERIGDVGRRVEERIKQGAAWLERMAATAGQNRQPETEEERIRKKIEKREKERQGFITHFVIYLMVNLGLWIIWAMSSAPSVIELIGDPEFTEVATAFPWPLLVSIFWGAGLIAHYLDYHHNHGAGAQRREERIQREIERERERSALYEKPKNDPRVRLELTDDGEIIEVEDEASRAAKHKRG